MSSSFEFNKLSFHLTSIYFENVSNEDCCMETAQKHHQLQHSSSNQTPSSHQVEGRVMGNYVDFLVSENWDFSHSILIKLLAFSLFYFFAAVDVGLVVIYNLTNCIRRCCCRLDGRKLFILPQYPQYHQHHKMSVTVQCIAHILMQFADWLFIWTYFISKFPLTSIILLQ